MKIPAPASRLACLGLAVTLGLPVFVPAAATGKTHVLFMGAELAVERNKRYHRVEDVNGSEFKIRIGKKEFFVPTRNRGTDLKVSHSLKLTATAVRLDELRGGPAYTTANDPVRKMIAASGSAGAASAAQDLSQGHMIMKTDAEAHAADFAARYAGIPEARELAQTAAAQAMIERQEAETAAAVANHSLMYSSQNSAAAQVDKMQGELAEGNHDAMEVSFRISSPVELDDPYMVVLFKFRERDAKPGEEGLLVHAKSLDPIGPKPKYIRIREAGLPRGFQYLDSTVHIYNRGEEVATNASPKRVELTRDEAQQYLVIEHIGANKGVTVAAIPVPGTLSITRRQELSIDQLNRLCYAKVAPDGSLLGVYLDESCRQPLEDAGARAALGDVFFKPALEKGQPVEGVARFTLGSI